jgi:ATP-dependent RNA helicase DDX55/SPB4
LVGGSNRSVIHDLEAFHEHGSDIIIATPGRLYDIMSRYEDLNVSSLECFVLDEADILLDLGFSDVLSNILGKLPKMRRTGLFSATQTKAVKSLGRAGLRNPVVIRVSVLPSTAEAHINDTPTSTVTNHQPTPLSLTNYYMISPLEEKISRLMAFLNQHKDEKVVVFCLTCACVDFYGCVLPQLTANQKGICYMEALHGKMVQKKREKVLERFRECSAGVLFCTDVAARGLDVDKVNWIVQLDAPRDPHSFVHRVGRCARAGRSGKSLLLLTPSEDSYIEFLQLRNIPIEMLPTSECCLLPIARIPEQGEEDYSPARCTTTTNDGNYTGVPDILPSIKGLVLQDRDALEKGTKAYTSYIRAYKEHHCSFIFRYAQNVVLIQCKPFLSPGKDNTTSGILEPKWYLSQYRWWMSLQKQLQEKISSFSRVIFATLPFLQWK